MISREQAVQRLKEERELERQEAKRWPGNNADFKSVPVNCGSRTKPKPRLDEIERWGYER